MDDWYFAQVKPNADRITKRDLKCQGFVTVEPSEGYVVVQAGRFQKLLRLFFAGYRFLRYSGNAAPSYLVNATYGVARLVRNGDRPASVLVTVFEELKQACDRDDIIQRILHLGKGTDAEVSFDCLRNFVGKVERSSPAERAMVLLDFMWKQTMVALPSSRLRVARSLRG